MPIVESELVLEAEGYTVVLPVTVKVVAKQVKQVDLDKTILAKIGQRALNSVGYEEIMRMAEEQGWVKTVRIEQAQSAAEKRFIADGTSPVIVAAQAEFKRIMTKAAPVALAASQADTPAPGIGDIAAVGILAVALIAVGSVTAYDIITAPPTATTTTAPASAAQPKAPPAPPPPPPPPPPRETCEANSELNKYIRCDDPGISHYDDRNENTAFTKVVKQLGKGLSKGKSKDKAEGGPCEGRGGFHTNVLRAGKSVASIMGCYCCDDSSGKAIQKERTKTDYK